MADEKNSQSNKILAAHVLPISIERELKTSFLDYAMSVIVSRALPDVRDGLKPVHRRILYAMHQLGYYHEKPHRKSAAVVGEVMKDFHPHGDGPIYQSIVSLVQTFSKRYPLLDGQGNWGSVDGDEAASMRYTEVRMARIAREVLSDIEKETVPFTANYDESCLEPTLLPSKIPNILVNGVTGIAVGMATSIPPHNLNEVMDACIALVRDSELSDDELFRIIPAPDFPTGGIICGRAGVVKAYRTGHGQVIMRAVVDVEETKKHTALIIKELPFQMNKAQMIAKVADLVKDKVIDGISNIRDESDRRGIRVMIEVKRTENPQVILNQLYRHAGLQTSMSILLLGLYQNRPMIFTLREIIEHFIEHRKDIILKRCLFDLKKHQSRCHILDGLIIALNHIDAMILLIKQSADGHEAVSKLQAGYALSEPQAKAILDMRLQRLTGLEKEKIHAEMKELQEIIFNLKMIINDDAVLKKEMIKEFEYLKKTYGDERKTKIEHAVDILSEADLVPDEEVVVTLTRKGYLKRVPLHTYVLQHRGGKGKKGTADLEESDDCMQDLFVAKNHDELLFFTSKGRVYSFRVFQVPEGSRTAKGRAIINLLPLTEGETVVKLLCMRGMENKFIVFVTKNGTIKKTNATAFAKIRSTGIHAVTLDTDDELAFCAVSSGKDSIVLATSKGQGIRFAEHEVRPMGRQASGVRGIRLRSDDSVVGLEVIGEQETGDLLFATSHGYGKRVEVKDFRLAHRGGIGVRTIPTDNRNGLVIGLVLVGPKSNILLIDNNGKIIRLSPQEVRTMGRQAKGVRLIRLDKSQLLSGIAAFEEEEQTDQEEVGTVTGAELSHAEMPESDIESDSDDNDDDDEGDTAALDDGTFDDTEYDDAEEPGDEE